MPELPEVETIVRGLSAKILFKTIERVAVLDARMLRAEPEPFIRRLTGARVSAIRRHGKAVFVALEKGAERFFLRVHLGMTGQLVFERPDEPIIKHTHIVFHLGGLAEDLRYRDARRFGRIGIMEESAAALAPDAWDTPVEGIFRALRKKTGMLKHALMNQRVIAGLGNIYVDESLHRAGLHPRRNLESVSDAKLHELCAGIREVLAESLNVGGTSFRNYVDTRGSRGGFKGRLKVYGKTGTRCSCGGVIRRIVVASRGTHFCPSCQRPPR